ncbi:MAG: hypothetical protein ACLQDI_02305, partial [Syntrophobacteraceae bacterium]
MPNATAHRDGENEVPPDNHKKINGLLLLAIVCTISLYAWLHFTKAGETASYYWMMTDSPPDDSVRVWIPIHGEHEKTCRQDEKMSRAMALATVLTLEYEIARYSIKSTNRGLELNNDIDPGPVHYHGVYVDLDTAKRLIESVKWGWSPDCIIREVAFDSDVFAIDIFNR